MTRVRGRDRGEGEGIGRVPYAELRGQARSNARPAWLPTHSDASSRERDGVKCGLRVRGGGGPWALGSGLKPGFLRCQTSRTLLANLAGVELGITVGTSV